jgi:large subunit ribosomal protein L10
MPAEVVVPIGKGSPRAFGDDAGFLWKISAKERAAMSDNKQAKAVIVSQIEEKLGRAQSAVLIDYIGLTVAEVTELRNQFRAAGVEYKVLKNTMINRAANGLGIRGLEKLSGPTAVAFSYGDPTLGARIILDYQKKTKKTQIKSAILGRKIISAVMWRS